MADNRVQIIIDAKGGSQAAQEFQKAMKGMETLESKAASTSSSISGLASTFGKVSGAVSLAASAIAAAAIKLGSDYQKAVFAMSETFKARTDEMVKTAQGMSEKMKNYYDFTEIAYAFQKTSDSMQRYGITGDKYLKLVERAADVGAAKNLDLKESIDRIESAIRGEAEASEYLGATLNDTYMKNMAFNGALKDQWEKLSDNEKAYYRWIELMQQTEKYQGATVRATDTLSGALASLGNSIKDDFAPNLKIMADELTTVVNKMREWYDINAKVKAQGRVAPDPLGLTAMYEPGPERSNLSWGGLKSFEAEQRANEAKAHGLALTKESVRLTEEQNKKLKDQEALLKGAESAQEKFVKQVARMNEIWPYGGDDYKKVYAKAWEDLLKATQEKTPKVANKIDSNLVKMAEWVARYYGISEKLFKALIQQESGWKVGAVGPLTKYGRAQGLTQLIPSTAAEMGVKNPFDAFQNLMGGGGYLRKLIDMFKNIELALAGYNAGPYNKYVQAGKIPPYPETQNYVKSIMGAQGVGDELTWMLDDQQKKIDEYWENWNRGAREALDTEISTMRDILDSDNLTASERVVIQEQYLAKRKQQIQAESAEIERVTENKILAEKWAAEQIKQEQNKLVEHNIQKLQQMLEEENLTLQRREEIWRQIRERIQAGEVSLMDALKLGWREAVSQMNSAAQNMNDLGKQAATGLRNALKDSFVALAKGDIKSLADAWERFADLMLNKWAEMLADAIMKWLDFSGSLKGGLGGGGGLGDIFGGLFGWLGKLFGGGGGTCPIGHGGVFSGAGIGAYSSSVVMRPTLFPFAHGVGLMGEAGPEGILPLTRTRNGDLGVKVIGDRQPMVVNIHEAPGTKARAEQDENGNLNVMIEQVEQSISSRISRGSGLSGFLDTRYRRRM